MNPLDPQIAAMFQQFLSGGTTRPWEAQLPGGPNLGGGGVSAPSGGGALMDAGESLGGLIGSLTEGDEAVGEPDPSMDPTYHDPAAGAPARPWQEQGPPVAPPRMESPDDFRYLTQPRMESPDDFRYLTQPGPQALPPVSPQALPPVSPERMQPVADSGPMSMAPGGFGGSVLAPPTSPGGASMGVGGGGVFQQDGNQMLEMLLSSLTPQQRAGLALNGFG